MARAITLFSMFTLCWVCMPGCNGGSVDDVCQDVDEDGYGPGCQAGADCDDGDDSVYQYLEGYTDGDGDGYGVEPARQVCSGAALPPGYAPRAGDCDDSDDTVWDDCPVCADADGDGRGEGCAAGLDCNDADDTVWDACPVTLAWEEPTTNVDGSPLDDLAGYKLYWTATAGAYDHEEDLGLGASCSQTAPGQFTCRYTLQGFAAGTYRFVATAYNAELVESAYSNEATATLR